jgi:uncharacterized membrane protein YfhO
VEGSGSNVSDQGQAGILREEFYDPSKPLMKDHYDAQQRAALKWQDQTNKMLEMKQLEDRVKKNINIVFWKEVRIPIDSPQMYRLTNRPI